MSQLNDFLTRIADIQIGINVSGLGNPWVLSAEPYQPSDATGFTMPMFINEIHGGLSDLPITDGQQRRNTDVVMYLLVARKEANINLKYGVSNTAQWVDSVYAKFAQHLKLSAPAINILSSTNTNPIQITTAVPHRFISGDPVTIANHLVNTNANGSWIATVPDPTNPNSVTFTIPAVGNGVGGQTGTAIKTQPVDKDYILQAYISQWNLVDYAYGSSVFLALRFVLKVTEFYVTTIAP